MGGGLSRMCGMEARAMRKMILALAMMLVLAGGRTVYAQEILDPTTGIDIPNSDSADFWALMDGQPTNAAAEESAVVSEEQQAQSANDFQDFTDKLMSANQNDDDDSTPVIVTPNTPKPTMSPNGGKFVGSVQIALMDADPHAVVHFTTNGKKATAVSPVYTGPITVTGKEKVSAVAIDPADRASGAVSKTFKPKG